MINQFLQLLDFETLATQAVSYAPKVAAALVVMLAFWILYRITRGPLVILLERSGLHEALTNRLVHSFYRFVILIFGAVMAAEQVGINVGAALAGIGIAGVAIGFAAQDSIANILAGLFILLDKPFEVTDWVTVSDQYGEVVEITMRTTRIRTVRNTYVVMPNKSIVDAVLENHSKHGSTRVDVPIGIAYKEYIPDARKVVLEAVRGLDEILKTPEPDVVVTEMADSSINMNVRIWINEASREMPIKFKVLEACKLALDKAGIEIPFPHLQLFVDNVEDRVWEKVGKLARPA